MAFTSLSASNLETGDPVTTTDMNLVRTNLDDLDSRVTTLEAGAASVIPIEFNLQGAPEGLVLPFNGAGYFRIPFDMDLLAGRVIALSAGTAGSHTVDLKLGTISAPTTIFSVVPTVAFGAGDGAIGTGTLSTTSASAGDWLRLDITAAQTGGVGMKVILEYQPS